MVSLLRRRPAFRRLWFASTASLVGDWLGFVAISLLAIDRGGGAFSLALVFAVHSLPRALLTPVAGVVADRFDRRRLLITVPLLQAVLTAAMALAAARGLLPLVQVLVLVRSAGTAFMMPAETAALRHTVEPEELLPANAILSGTWSVTYVAGMALGGAIAVLGPVPAILIDASSFLIAAALLQGLPSMRVEPASSPAPARLSQLLATVPRDLWTALLHVARRPELLRAVFIKAPVALAGGAGWVVLNLVADHEQPFGSAAVSLGVLQAVRGAGTGLGPAAVSRFPHGGRAAKVVEHLVIVLAFVAIALFPHARHAPALLAIVALAWGMGTGSNWVLSSAAMQRLSPDQMIGRLSSLDELSGTSAMVASALLGGALIERGSSLITVASLGPALGLLLWAMILLGSRTGAERAGVGAPLGS
jgi:MFS family permease